MQVDRHSAVGIATRYGLGGPGIESCWGRDFPHQSRTALGPTKAPIQWVPASFPAIKRLERGVNYQPPSSAEINERDIPLLLLWAFAACSRVTFTFTFSFSCRYST